MSKTLAQIDKLKCMLIFHRRQPRAKTKIKILMRSINKLEKKYEREMLEQKLTNLQLKVKEIKYKLNK
jgi:hypothetical protein